ncbi:MAG: hypothetical protein ABSH32_03525 [Bryobacteraceae bacterium]
MSPINNLSSNYLQSIFSNTLQSSGLTSNTTGNASSVTSQTDSQQLSPFAQLMSTLQQLQQSNPTEYQQVTQQIATNLQSAAKTATADGNSTAASQLNQLATDFTNASTSGQLPNVQDLAQAIGGGHHHHHHFHAASTDSGNNSGDSSSSGTSSSGASQTLSQLLSSVQANSTSSDSLNPMTIILNTLSSAGISNG